MNNIISIKNIFKNYKSNNTLRQVLQDINLDIAYGSWTLFYGKSGSGKSTLLNLIAGLDLPTKGEILIDKKILIQKKAKNSNQIRQKIFGIVFQSFHLLNEFSVYDNIILPALFTKRKKKDINIQAKKLINKFNLEKVINQKPNTLSGGEQQRVAIARALINQPEIILADEPTGNLDEQNSKIIMDIFQELKEQGKTIIMVSHDQTLRKYANKIINLKQGKIDVN